MPNINALLINNKTTDGYRIAVSLNDSICYTVSLSNNLIFASDFAYKDMTSHTFIIPPYEPYAGVFPCCVMPMLLCLLLWTHALTEDSPSSL